MTDNRAPEIFLENYLILVGHSFHFLQKSKVSVGKGNTLVLEYTKMKNDITKLLQRIVYTIKILTVISRSRFLI